MRGTRHFSASPYEDQVGFARGVRVGDTIHVAGTAPIGPDGKTVAGGPYEQAHRCFSVAIQAIEALGGTAADVVRTRMYLTDAADEEAVGRAHKELVGAARPAATMIVVAALLDPAWRVEIEVEAYAGG